MCRKLLILPTQLRVPYEAETMSLGETPKSLETHPSKGCDAIGSFRHFNQLGLGSVERTTKVLPMSIRPRRSTR